MHKAPDVFPLVGGRKIEHLRENIAALNVRLSEEEIKEIDDAGEPFKMGFPYNLLGGREPGAVAMKEVALLRAAGRHDFHDIRKVWFSLYGKLIAAYTSSCYKVIITSVSRRSLSSFNSSLTNQRSHA